MFPDLRTLAVEVRQTAKRHDPAGAWLVQGAPDVPQTQPALGVRGANSVERKWSCVCYKL